MSLKHIYSKVCNGTSLTGYDIQYLIDLPHNRLSDFLEYAHALRRKFFGNDIALCAIINAKSGTCSENCTFCAQSAHHQAHSPTYPLLETHEILAAGSKAKSHGVTRFGVVASGKLVNESDLQGFVEAVKGLAQNGLEPDLSPGILDYAQLKRLKNAGLRGYHHNLETSASFFPQMCSTHTYEEDVNAVKTALKAGLYVCSGGIFGIGESWDDRVELALLLRDLGVHSIPINFLHPIPGTPLESQPPLCPEEALKIIALYRFLLPDRALRVCGGRLSTFGGSRKHEVLTSGTNGLMVGDYLTTQGGDIVSDKHEILQSGLRVEKKCPNG